LFLGHTGAGDEVVKCLTGFVPVDRVEELEPVQCLGQGTQDRFGVGADVVPLSMSRTALA
jgi:hypothetical protein